MRALCESRVLRIYMYRQLEYDWRQIDIYLYRKFNVLKLDREFISRVRRYCVNIYSRVKLIPYSTKRL